MNRIKELREKLNMSLDDFAKHTGKSKASIYRWETEQRKIKVEDAKDIANSCNVSLTWLMGYEAPPTPVLSTAEVSLLAMFSLLSEQEQNEVIRYISNIIMRRNKQ